MGQDAFLVRRGDGEAERATMAVGDSMEFELRTNFCEFLGAMAVKHHSLLHQRKSTFESCAQWPCPEARGYLSA